ncbi:hypothetical protein [Ralstonia solanacearum]|uniref:hypothetical protein n=1 Tax=Ralstonia solanacearum TaxID=305 RepID=UPI001E3A225F|nr:hypothetical protein [Ralstonia solanacearum]
MLPARRNAEYSGLMAAPGTPKAVVMPSFSSTATAASIALIFGMVGLQEGDGGDLLELILFPHTGTDKRSFCQLIANAVYRIRLCGAAIRKQGVPRRSAQRCPSAATSRAAAIGAGADGSFTSLARICVIPAA